MCDTTGLAYLLRLCLCFPAILTNFIPKFPFGAFALFEYHQ
jgi:hypothetical protein